MISGVALDLAAPLGAVGVSLRPVEAADGPFLRRLFYSTRWDELQPTGWPDEAKTGFLDQQFGFQQRHYDTAFPGAEFYLVLRHGEPIGRLYIAVLDRILHLMEISLLPDWRGHGLGAALLATLQQAVRAGHADEILLNVLTTNPARRLYTRLGFIEFGGDAEFPGPSIEMRWRP